MKQVADLQINLKTEQEVVEEKKARTSALIESIGQEKAVVDEAVESSRADEEAAAALQVQLTSAACNINACRLTAIQRSNHHGIPQAAAC